MTTHDQPRLRVKKRRLTLEMVTAPPPSSVTTLQSEEIEGGDGGEIENGHGNGHACERLAVTVKHPDDLTPEWREWYEERAAIREYMGGGDKLETDRAYAERQALMDTIFQMGLAEDGKREPPVLRPKPPEVGWTEQDAKGLSKCRKCDRPVAWAMVISEEIGEYTPHEQVVEYERNKQRLERKQRAENEAAKAAGRKPKQKYLWIPLDPDGYPHGCGTFNKDEP